MGCRDSHEATVTGKLTSGGEPVPLALIQYHAVGSGPMPYGLSDENGIYELLTGSKRGLPPGKYKAVIDATTSDVPVPKIYRIISTTTLEYDIRPGKNKIDIQL